MRLYLAGPFFDDEQIERIERVEVALNENSSVDSYFSPRKSDAKIDAEVGTRQWAKEVFNVDVNEIQKADAVIAIIDFVDNNVDSGTAFEIGYAHAINKPVVLFHEKDGIVNLMLTNAANSYLTTISEIEKFDFVDMPEYLYNGPVF